MRRIRERLGGWALEAGGWLLRLCRLDKFSTEFSPPAAGCDAAMERLMASDTEAK